MITHPYLRAFLAGAFMPTLVLPLILTLFIVVRVVLECPVPIERGMVFPMALAPCLWALWNMLWMGTQFAVLTWLPRYARDVLLLPDATIGFLPALVPLGQIAG